MSSDRPELRVKSRTKKKTEKKLMLIRISMKKFKCRKLINFLVNVEKLKVSAFYEV